MFDPLYSTYKKIITGLGIVGYLEEDIIKRGLDTDTNLPLNLLYSFPNKETTDINNLIFQMMFPDDDHKIQTPKFFSLTLTNEQANRSFLYCLKFPEKFYLPSENDEQNKEKEEVKEEKKEVSEKAPKKEKVEKPVEVSEKKEEAPKAPKAEKAPKIDLTILTVSELKELAKKKEIKGYSKMKKDELIEVLK